MASSGHCYIFSLPNELLLHILAVLPTPELLPLTTVSHRLTSLILRVLYTRLQLAASLHGHTLILECYHPSAKLTEPPLYCTYLGTPGLDDTVDPWKIADETVAGPGYGLGNRLATMRGMYSRFRPHRNRKDVTRPVRRHPAGDVPGSRTHPSSSSSPLQKYGDGEEELVRQLLTLDGHELFTQLCSVTNLVKVGPRNGLFRCFVEVEDGVVRVWRDWLANMTEGKMTEMSIQERDEINGSKGKGKFREDLAAPDVSEDEKVLWVSRSKNVGLRFRVRERRIHRELPVLMYANEEVAVSYDIEYEGELMFCVSGMLALTNCSELLVRTSHLLLALEQSFHQQDNYSSKAIVFGSFG